MFGALLVQQRHALDRFRTFPEPVAVGEFGTADRQHRFGQEIIDGEPRIGAAPVADDAIRIAGIEIGQLCRGIDEDLQARRCATQRIEPWDQPFAGEGRSDGHTDRLFVVARHELRHRRQHGVEGRGEARHQCQARRRQLQLAARAVKQRLAEIILQQPDLLADGG